MPLALQLPHTFLLLLISHRLLKMQLQDHSLGPTHCFTLPQYGGLRLGSLLRIQFKIFTLSFEAVTLSDQTCTVYCLP